MELAATDVWEVEQGYRIRKDQYYLPEVAFTPDEVWALFVAAHTPGESGEVIAERTERLGRHDFAEVAYGWRDLTELVTDW